MKTSTKIVSDLQALDALGPSGSIGMNVRGEIILSFPELSAEEIGHWQHRLTKFVFACGCGMATGIGISSIILFSIWPILASPSGISSLTWIDIFLALLVFIVSTGIGKAIGLAGAKIVLHMTKTRLHTLVVARANSMED